MIREIETVIRRIFFMADATFVSLAYVLSYLIRPCLGKLPFFRLLGPFETAPGAGGTFSEYLVFLLLIVSLWCLISCLNGMYQKHNNLLFCGAGRVSLFDPFSPPLMDIFCKDTKLNISHRYLKPGIAYGGSCLPKDLKALCTIAHDNYLSSPVLENIFRSNENHKDTVLNRIIEFGKRRIGFAGLSFKAGTDDLRNSPIVDIIEKLLGKGYDIKIDDSFSAFCWFDGWK